MVRRALGLATGLLVGGVLAAPASADTAPSNVTPPVISGQAIQGQTLSVSSGSWAGTAPIALGYQWERCNAGGAGCSAISSATGQTYAAAAADVGGTLRVQVTASNGAGSAQLLSAPTAVVVAAAGPANTVAPSLSGVAQVGQTLTAAPGTWTGAPAPTFATQWQRCDSAGDNCANISGATSQSYTAAAADAGSRVQAVVTATNPSGSAAKSSAQTAVVTSLPASTAPPTVAGSLVVGQTLTAGDGTWSGVPAPTTSYQWQRCDSSGANCSNISGATGQTYALGSPDAGHRLRVVVTAGNSVGSASAASSPTGLIASAVAPSSTAHPTMSGSQLVGQTLTANVGSWRGTPPLVYGYQWQRCDTSGKKCASISGAGSQTYTLAPGDFNHRLQVLVSASNSVGSSSRLSGQTSLIRSAPVNTEQPTVFGNPAAGQTLTLGAGEWIGTAPLTYSYQWQRCDSAGANCTAVPGATNHSYLVGGADAGSRMQVVVTAKNGLGAASAASAPATVVTATPTAPSSIALPSVLGLPALGNLLRATDGRWGGFPVPTLSYQWQRCTTAAPASCTGIPGAVATAYRIRSGDVGRSLRIVVTGANTLGTTSASSSPTGRVTAVKAQRRVIAVRSAVLGPSGPRIRLVLVELRGRFNRSYWLELDALRSGRWRHVATARIVRGPLATTTIVGFTAHAQRGAAKVTVRWRDAAGRTDESVFVARPGSLRVAAAPSA